MVEFSSNISAIYTKWCAQTFSAIFLLFAIFDRNFSQIVAPPNNGNENYGVHLKELSLLKKHVNLLKSAIKRQRNACLNYVPSNEQRSGLGALQTKKKNKHHIFAPTAGAHYAIFPKLCMVIQLVETIKKVPSIFWSNV